MSATLDNPAAVVARLEEIERDLAVRQNALESAGMAWFRCKRDREHAFAVALLTAEANTVAERKAMADRETSLIGRDEEAEWEALSRVVRVLETRANIGMALLKSQGRS